MTYTSIAVVGPSGHLQGLNLGRKIDSHECIIRVNEFGPINDQDSYGSRTDVVFHNFMPGTLHILENEAREYAERMSNPVRIICPRNTHQIGEEFLPLERVKSLLPKGFSVELMEIKQSGYPLPLPENPTTGFYAIIWAFTFPIRAFVCGFNFYSSKKTYHHEKHANRIKNGFPQINVSGHKTKEEVAFLKRFLDPYTIDCDAEFSRLVLRGEYRGKYLPLFALQVTRNSLRGIKMRAWSLFGKESE